MRVAVTKPSHSGNYGFSISVCAKVNIRCDAAVVIMNPHWQLRPFASDLGGRQTAAPWEI
jgi:hypothetical protein